jgi:uncharacterized protein
MVSKVVVVDFTDGAKKPYTGVPDTVLSDTEKANQVIKARAKKDEPKRIMQSWIVEDGQRFIAPTVDTEISSFDYFPGTFILSKKGKRIIKLNELVTKGEVLQAQKGLSEKEIIQNLRNLTINCLDPIKAKYPNMIISSGFRRCFQPPESVDQIKKFQKSKKIKQTGILDDVTQTAINKVIAEEKSDHQLGAAADIVFQDTPIEDYLTIVQWIQQNIPHKQLLLEYKTGGDNQPPLIPWIHIAFLLANGSLLKSEMTIGTYFNQALNTPNKFVPLA